MERCQIPQLKNLPKNHHLNLWARAYYLAQQGFSMQVLLSETDLTYKQLRRVREEVVKGSRKAFNSFARDIQNAQQLREYSKALAVFLELQNVSGCEFVEDVIAAFRRLARKYQEINAPQPSISGYYWACKALIDGTAELWSCGECRGETYQSDELGSRIGLLGFITCPYCGASESWSEREHIYGRMTAGLQMSIF